LFGLTIERLINKIKEFLELFCMRTTGLK